MGLKSGQKCAIWSLEDKGNYIVANISTSKKKKDSKDYETDWRNNYVWLCDRAYENFKSYIPLNEGEYIEARIGWGYDRVGNNGNSFKQAPFEVTSNYVKDKNKEYTNYKVYDAAPIGGNKEKEPEQTETQQDIMSIPDTFEDSLPFK